MATTQPHNKQKSIICFSSKHIIIRYCSVCSWHELQTSIRQRWSLRVINTWTTTAAVDICITVTTRAASIVRWFNDWWVQLSHTRQVAHKLITADPLDCLLHLWQCGVILVHNDTMLHRNYFEYASGVVEGIKIDPHCCFYTLCRGSNPPTSLSNTPLPPNVCIIC